MTDPWCQKLNNIHPEKLVFFMRDEVAATILSENLQNFRNVAPRNACKDSQPVEKFHNRPWGIRFPQLS